MRTRFRNRYLVFAYMIVLAIAFVVGCTTREDPSEELVVCGNHTCGQLTMVTIDTNGPGGYQYLEPAISPDGTRVAFSADWASIPSLPEDEVSDPILNRQILVMPLPADPWSEEMNSRNPVPDIQELGAELVLTRQFISRIGGGQDFVDDPTSGVMTKASPNWIDDSTLLIQTRFERRDRLVSVDISDLGNAQVTPLFYEPQDTLTTGFRFWYHHDPSLSPDKRWCVFTRFGCDDESNVEDANCDDEQLWVIDMTTTDDPVAVTAFPITSGAVSIEDPSWSPDGRTIVFAATTDLVGDGTGFVGELFRVDFDPEAAETGVVPLDQNLRRITTTEVSMGDPLVGLHNYAPVFSADGLDVIFTSSRRAPGSTQRGRNLWRVPADGRLEPEMVFFSRYDDIHPTFDWETGSFLFSSRMGFPTEMLDAIEQETIDFFTNVYNDTARVPLTEVEILRRAADDREELELFEGKMGHLYMFRGL
ncbi:hypothetical protein GF314_11475 [bacterium]|nr:hypothetical protein [bacterium]